MPSSAPLAFGGEARMEAIRPVTDQVPAFVPPLIATVMISGSAFVPHAARQLSAKGGFFLYIKCMLPRWPCGLIPPPACGCEMHVQGNAHCSSHHHHLQCSAVQCSAVQCSAVLKRGAGGEERPLLLTISPVPSQPLLPHFSLQST